MGHNLSTKERLELTWFLEWLIGEAIEVADELSIDLPVSDSCRVFFGENPKVLH